jgi:exodeoxyribonuclease VII large subunit
MQRPLPSVAVRSVSDVLAAARAHLEHEFSEVWIEGEISGLRAPASGHLYFTLKDAQAQLRAVVFRGVALRLRFGLQDGLSVVARGRLTIYEARGDFQIVLEYVEPKGLGALQLAFEQLRERLAREGLFDESQKQPLPRYPRAVGLVTSLHGAALHDMLTVLRRRCPTVRIVVAPVSVQGEEAADQIAKGVRALDDPKLVDVIIVGRGGGSLEDLWSFNEEAVVRAIAACRVPIVSAVGHEIDYTLADFAADYRAPTPSAAAEAVVPVLADLRAGLLRFQGDVVQALQSRLAHRHRALARSNLVLQRGQIRFQRVAQRLDDLLQIAETAMRALLRAREVRLLERTNRLRLDGPAGTIRDHLAVVPQLARRVQRGMEALLVRKRLAGRHALSALGGLNPLAILSRGYAVLTRQEDGRVIKSVSETRVDEELIARLYDGRLLCYVRKLIPQG